MDDSIPESTRRPLIRQLSQLSRDSPQFPEQLTPLLAGVEIRHRISDFSDRDVRWFVNYLDNILASSDWHSPTSRGRYLRALHRICGTYNILPDSFALPDNPSISSIHPVSSCHFTEIYQGNLNGVKVAVKRARAHPSSGRDALSTVYQEAVFWKHVRHFNIVPFIGVTASPLQLVSEWMPGGTLTEYLKIRPDANRYSLLLGIAAALTYLHSFDIVHGNLKGSSILVDGSGNARLADFSLATVIPDPEITGSFRGRCPIRWTAPEILGGKSGFSKEGDVYSFGMVAYEVFGETIPWANSTPTAVVARVLLGERPPRPGNPTLSERAWDLIQQCWMEIPGQRMKIKDIICYLEREQATKQDRARTPDGTKDVTLGINFPGTIPTGSKRTRFVICLSKLRRHPELENTCHKSGHTSECAHTLKSKGSLQSLQCVELGYSHAPGVAPSGPRNLLRRATAWLLSCGAPSSHDCQDGIPVLLAKETHHAVIGIDRGGVGSHAFGQLPVAGPPAYTSADVAPFR